MAFLIAKSSTNVCELSRIFGPTSTRVAKSGLDARIAFRIWYTLIIRLSFEDACLSHVTRILSQIESGDPSAAEQLLPLVYDELRKLAAARLAHEKPGQTLQATALVHDAYLRLVDVEKAQHWNGRGHFFAAAAEAMRRILVENARRRASLKRGAQAKRVELDERTLICEERTYDLLELDEALRKLEGHDPDAGRLVKLRFFAGLGHQEAAEAMGLSRGAADRLWALARAWLYRELGEN